MSKQGLIGRRGFIAVGAAAGGGLLVGVRLFSSERQDSSASLPPGPGSEGPSDGGAELHAFVEISEDGAVTITAPCPEIGQGVRTSLAQLLAEELDVPWNVVSVRQGEANSRYGPQAVGGSDSVRDYWDPLRRAGATARELLKAAAAEQWEVDAAECAAELGTVRHEGSGRRATYGALAGMAASIARNVDPTLKDPADFVLIGTSPTAVDGTDIVTGAAVYGTDVRVPDMLRAVVARPPTHGARLVSLDTSEALAVGGVRNVLEVEPTVPGGDYYAAVRGGVAVIAENTWSAIRGRDALALTWSNAQEPLETSSAIEARMSAALHAESPHVLRSIGAPDEAFRDAVQTLQSEYHLPPLAHVCMEPVNSTAHARPDGCDIWGPVQNPQRLRTAVARALGMPLSAVHVHPTLAGGGFGRRLAVDYGVEAALISRGADVPVQVLWTREDDIRFDYLRPPSSHRVRAALTSDGRVVAWEHHVATPSLLRHIEADDDGTHPAIYDVQGAADVPLAVPNLRVLYSPVEVRLQMGSWRSVAHSFNTFVVNSFIDELAATVGGDPYEMHRTLLGEPRSETIPLPLPGRRGRPRPDVARILRVLSVAAERSGWGAPPPSGWGRGMAWCEYKGSYAAHVAEVSTASGGARVRRVVVAVDCGRLINPSGARAQAEGAVMDGVSTVFHWGARIRDGGVAQSNLDDYPLARVGEAPEVDVHFIESDEPPSGAGEPPYPSVAPAITNALFDAGHSRIRRLPLAGS